MKQRNQFFGVNVHVAHYPAEAGAIPAQHENILHILGERDAIISKNPTSRRFSRHAPGATMRTGQ